MFSEAHYVYCSRHCQTEASSARSVLSSAQTEPSSLLPDRHQPRLRRHQPSRNRHQPRLRSHHSSQTVISPNRGVISPNRGASSGRQRDSVSRRHQRAQTSATVAPSCRVTGQLWDSRITEMTAPPPLCRSLSGRRAISWAGAGPVGRVILQQRRVGTCVQTSDQEPTDSGTVSSSLEQREDKRRVQALTGGMHDTMTRMVTLCV